MRIKYFIVSLVSIVPIFISGIASADTSGIITERGDKVIIPHDADNSGKNLEDRSNRAALTSDDQSESAADRTLAAAIRRDVVGDGSLSTYAHNVKIIVNNGKTTLRGPVNSTVEEQKIVAIAAKHSSLGAVTDQLEIAPQ